MAAIPPGTAAQRVDLTLYPHDDIRQAMVEAGFNPVLTVEAPRRKLLPKILAYLEGKWRRAGDRIAGPGSEVALLVRNAFARNAWFVLGPKSSPQAPRSSIGELLAVMQHRDATQLCCVYAWVQPGAAVPIPGQRQLSTAVPTAPYPSYPAAALAAPSAPIASAWGTQVFPTGYPAPGGASWLPGTASGATIATSHPTALATPSPLPAHAPLGPGSWIQGNANAAPAQSAARRGQTGRSQPATASTTPQPQPRVGQAQPRSRTTPADARATKRGGRGGENKGGGQAGAAQAQAQGPASAVETDPWLRAAGVSAPPAAGEDFFSLGGVSLGFLPGLSQMGSLDGEPGEPGPDQGGAGPASEARPESLLGHEDSFMRQLHASAMIRSPDRGPTPTKGSGGGARAADGGRGAGTAPVDFRAALQGIVPSKEAQDEAKGQGAASEAGPKQQGGAGVEDKGEKAKQPEEKGGARREGMLGEGESLLGSGAMSRFDLSLRGTGQGDDSMWRGAGGEAAPFLGLEGSLLGSDRVGGSATLDAFYREAMKGPAESSQQGSAPLRASHAAGNADQRRGVAGATGAPAGPGKGPAKRGKRARGQEVAVPSAGLSPLPGSAMNAAAGTPPRSPRPQPPNAAWADGWGGSPGNDARQPGGATAREQMLAAQRQMKRLATENLMRLHARMAGGESVPGRQSQGWSAPLSAGALGYGTVSVGVPPYLVAPR